MGPSLYDHEKDPVHYKLLSLFEKAGYEVIYPLRCKESVLRHDI